MFLGCLLYIWTISFFYIVFILYIYIYIYIYNIYMSVCLAVFINVCPPLTRGFSPHLYHSLLPSHSLSISHLHHSISIIYSPHNFLSLSLFITIRIPPSLSVSKIISHFLSLTKYLYTTNPHASISICICLCIVLFDDTFCPT